MFRGVSTGTFFNERIKTVVWIFCGQEMQGKVRLPEASRNYCTLGIMEPAIF